VREKTGVDEGNLLVAGFGQGGEAALSYALARPLLFRGAGSLNGVAADPQKLVEDVSPAHGQKLYLALASLDEEFIQRGHATKDALETAGFPLQFHEYKAEPAPEVVETVVAENEEYEEFDERPAMRGPHLEIKDFVTWLKETLPPY
jgi:predicted esterase